MRSWPAFEITKQWRFRSSLLLILILSLSGFHPAYGFDGSDTEIPRIEEMSLVNKAAMKANERIAILLKTSDDKNWVKLGGTLNIGYSYR
jgi:hypothetical protein